MGMDRRFFLKIAGLVSVSGLGINRIANALTQETETAQKNVRRWALVFDMQKCRKDQGCKDCMLACHKVHNVPEIENQKHEIKWIWKESYKHAFPSQNHEYISSKVKNNLAAIKRILCRNKLHGQLAFLYLFLSCRKNIFDCLFIFSYLFYILSSR